MRPKPVERLIIRHEHLSVPEIGEWSFEDDKVVFIAPDGTSSAIERPRDFVTIRVGIYHHGRNVVGLEGDGSPLWLLEPDGGISRIDEITRHRDAFGLDEPMFENVHSQNDDLLFVNDVGAYLFRDGALAWSVCFHEHGCRLDFDHSDYLSFTRHGLVFVTEKGGRKICRWPDGHVE